MKTESILHEAHLAPQPVDRMLTGLVRIGKFCLLLLVVPVVVEVYQMPQASLNAQRLKLEKLTQERDQLAATRDKLKRQLDWIKTDTAYLELRARDHEHMQQKGEYVIRIE
jgi:cell division protein FtsB